MVDDFMVLHIFLNQLDYSQEVHLFWSHKWRDILVWAETYFQRFRHFYHKQFFWALIIWRFLLWHQFWKENESFNKIKVEFVFFQHGQVYLIQGEELYRVTHFGEHFNLILLFLLSEQHFIAAFFLGSGFFIFDLFQYIYELILYFQNKHWSMLEIDEFMDLFNFWGIKPFILHKVNHSFYGLKAVKFHLGADIGQSHPVVF